MLGGYKYDGLLVLRDSVLFELQNSVVLNFCFNLVLISTLLKTRKIKLNFLEIKLSISKTSTTRSQKRKNAQREADDNVSEGFVSPIAVENSHSPNQDVDVAGPSGPKSPRISNSLLENLRASLNEEITSEIKNLLIESQKEMLKLLKPPETKENA